MLSNNIKKLCKFLQGKSSTSYIARGTIVSAALMVIGKILSYVTSVLFVRMSSPEEYGVYVYIMAWVGIASVIIRLGMDNVFLKFIPQYLFEKKWPLLKGILIKTHVIVLVLWVSLSVLVYFINKIYLSGDKKISVLSFIVIALIVLLISKNSLFQSSLRSFSRLFEAMSPDLLFRPLLILIISIICLFSYEGITSFQLLCINLAGVIGTFFLLGHFLLRTLPEKVKNCTAAYDISSWVKVGLPFLLLSGVNLIMSKTDLIMVGLFLPPANVAIYSACVDLNSMMLFLLTAASIVTVPLISNLFAQNKMTELKKLMILTTKGMFLFSLAMLFLLIGLGKKLLGIYDLSFVDGYVPLVILSIGFAINVSAGMVGALLNMTGRERVVTLTVGGCAILNVILNWILIPRYGLYGAASATSLSMVIWNVILFLFVYIYHLPKLCTPKDI